MSVEPTRSVNAAVVTAFLAAAGAILALQLLVPPVVGLADNRDYERVMGYAGFQHTTADPAQRYFSFVRTHYAVAAPGWFRGGYHSSETLLAFVARALHLAFRGGPVFDLRVLGAIHAALLLAALAGILRSLRELSWTTQALAALLLLFFFTDVGYVAPLNSFYSQAASLVFLLLAAAVATLGVRRGRLEGASVVAYFVAALLFVGSKPQEKLAAPLLALYGLRLAGVRWRGAWRQTATWLAAGLCAFAVWYGRHTPYTLREAAIYQVVFGEILEHSTDPAADSVELQLDPAWVRLAGTNPYAPDSPLLDPTFRMRLLHQVGYRRILGFYLRHPARLADRIQRASRQAWSLRPNFGNYEQSSERPTATLATRFSGWSRVRGRLGSHPLVWMALLLGGNLAAAAATHGRASPRGRLFREGLAVLVLMAGLAFAVCALAQAPTDLSRQLYAYHALCDLLLVADACWIAETVLRRRNPFQGHGFKAASPA
jgi:hypothetical protein